MGVADGNGSRFEVNSRKLFDKSDELDELFRMYIEDINPFIVRFEVAEGQFPLEVQNEIRAMYGHLVRAAMAETDEQVSNNIKK